MKLDIKNGTIHLGDCLEVLKTMDSESVDLVLTDPPYGMNFQSNHRKSETKHRKIANDDKLDWLPEFVFEVTRVMAPNTAAYVFCSFHQLEVFKTVLQEHIKVKNLLVWEKNNTSMGDLTGDFAPKVEFIFLCHKGAAKIRGKRDPNIFRFSRTGNKLHPTQKPVDLISYLMEKFSDPGALVLDPFLGSGTTAVAAERTGRRWVGIERDESYFALAAARICDDGA